MIIGMGSDLCNIERIEKSLERFGERFINRVFTDVRAGPGGERPFTRAGTYAKRFAAKEAFSKAVGTGFKSGVFMRDIGVVNKSSGEPTLALTGGAKERLDAITLRPRGAHSPDNDRRSSFRHGGGDHFRRSEGSVSLTKVQSRAR
jgi:holo-[acyl-carrier protein] synthase